MPYSRSDFLVYPAARAQVSCRCRSLSIQRQPLVFDCFSGLNVAIEALHCSTTGLNHPLKGHDFKGHLVA